MGVLVHIGNASEMDWIGHHVMMKRTWGDGDGEGQSVVCVETTCAKCATVGLASVPLRAAAQSKLRTSCSVRHRAAARTVAPIWGALGASMLGLLSEADVTL